MSVTGKFSCCFSLIVMHDFKVERISMPNIGVGRSSGSGWEWVGDCLVEGIISYMNKSIYREKFLCYIMNVQKHKIFFIIVERSYMRCLYI